PLDFETPYPASAFSNDRRGSGVQFAIPQACCENATWNQQLQIGKCQIANCRLQFDTNAGVDKSQNARLQSAVNLSRGYSCDSSSPVELVSLAQILSGTCYRTSPITRSSISIN